jgi:hypothetical protein
MKTFCLFIAISLSTPQVVCGEIKNGYALEIQNARQSLTGLNHLAAKSVSKAERRKIESKIHVVKNFICYHELTKNLLDQFRAIAPELYNEIDTIKDKRGRSTDIFIKFIPMSDSYFNHPGSTSLGYKEGDHDASYSEYGDQTVSITIWIMDNALIILSHELGHVKFQVPNLENYMQYYKETYGTSNSQAYLGHNPSDPSGKCAAQFERVFSKNYQNNLRIRRSKFISPFALLGLIRRADCKTSAL